MEEDQHKRKVAKVAVANPKNNTTLNPIYPSSPHGYATDASSKNGGSSLNSRNNTDASLDPVISHGNKIVTAYDYDHHYHHGASNYLEDAYLDSFPPGYRFKPYDEELVVHYLKKKIMNEPLPPNRIKEVELYKYNPETLAANYKSNGEKEWYFFTPRDRKYPNGERPNRAAGKGYWKATGADKPVNFEGCKVGFRKALVFYQGKPPNGDKTDWIMHEYRVNEPPKRKRGGNDMKLDDWVLCRIYKKLDRSFRAPTRPRVQVVQDHQPPENGMLLPKESKQIPMPTMAGNYSQGIEMRHLNTNAAYAPAYHLNGIGAVITESSDTSVFELPYRGNAVHPLMGTAGASSPSSSSKFSYMQSYISDEQPINEYLHDPEEFFAEQRMDSIPLPPLENFSPFP
ncbi:hypothetical protein P3X46_021244 [Hevea brasiliensis]|uniref:NAC domain-containing protein n=1 Tax=Hevea brasiliensis TaxID=3981 RepID=A0ABQ9LGZ2_HEVBR|nr:NAC transcription factor 56-like [Hevea brasiliensis]KAJ9166497.1 hypothetical protein P3X46_021244 [Hevea brasiliensis]